MIKVTFEPILGFVQIILEGGVETQTGATLIYLDNPLYPWMSVTGPSHVIHHISLARARWQCTF